MFDVDAYIILYLHYLLCLVSYIIFILYKLYIMSSNPKRNLQKTFIWIIFWARFYVTQYVVI